MKTLYKTATIVALLGGLVLAAQAQTVIGSWQSAPIPPSPANDEGWQRGQGGFGPNGSIFASSNYPAFFELQTNVAAGYAQSLVIHETGYGNDRLYVSLSAAQIAAFTNSTTLNFTLSVPPGDTNTASGYIQQVDFQYNSAGGFHNGAPSTAKGWSETGDTNNDSGGQPIFYYSTTAPARQQVVSWNYSSVLTNIVGSSFLQFVWVFQTSGGELTNIYINNVTLSGAPGNPSIIIDQFNGTNAYAGTNDYNVNDNITNVYNLWTGYGGNYVVNPDDGGVIWDPTQDANGNASSGSLKIIANWTNGAGQYLVWDRGPNNTFALNPPITNGYSLLTFEFDLKYDPSSPTVVNGTVTNYGHMEIGPVPPYSPSTFGTFDYDVTNTGWVHVTLPVNAVSDPADLLSINGLYFKQYGGFYGGLNGQTILWIDNIKFTYTNLPPVIPPPTVSIAKATPALRILAGDNNDIYHREELATTDQDKSWIGAARPSQYSFTLLSYPASINQTHIMLLPMNFLDSGQTAYGYNGVDYSYASNLVWFTIAPGPSAGSVVGRVQWKTNAAAANPNHTDVVFTNPIAVGTWTLEFDTDSGGQVLAPGGNSYPFTLSDPNVTADFGGPLVAYFGLQPNGTAGIGQYEDWASISITNVVGTSVYEDFTTEPTRSVSGPWNTTLQTAPSLAVVSTNDLPGYWFNWTTPAVNFLLGTRTNLIGSGNWVQPPYYSAGNDYSPLYGQPVQMGSKVWDLVASDNMPTANGLQGGPIAPMSFFLVSTNATQAP